DFRFDITDTAGRERSITGNVKVLNKAGDVLCDETATVSVPANGSASLSLAKSGLAIDETGNALIVMVTEGDTMLYYNKMPLSKLTDHYRTNVLESWLNGRPQSGEWDFFFAHRPGDGIIQLGVDLDFFGVPEAITKADRCEVVIANAKGKVLGKETFAIANLSGNSIYKIGTLPAGDYKATFTLYEGKKKVDSKELPFVRKAFAWETERLGLSNEVIPPYTPIQTGMNEEYKMPWAGVWNRRYFIDGSGLPSGIQNMNPNQQILNGAVRFEVNGTPLASSTPATLESASQAVVTFSGAAEADGIAVTTTASMEYDGWYDVSATISGVTPINAFDLVIPVPANYDTLYVHRNSDAYVGSYWGDVPAGTGAVWDSTSLARFKDNNKDWKSFVPVSFIGVGSRGLWLYTWSDKGWTLQDDEAALRVERDERGKLLLRARIISGGVTLEKPRTVRFALLAAPVKPLPDGYRNWRMVHDTSGYRYYGDSVDSYALHTPEDFEMFRKGQLYGPQTEFAVEWYRQRGYVPNHGRGAVWNSIPLVLYGSGQLTGLAMEEFDTFGGEWLGRNNWVGGVERHHKARPNYSGSHVWNSDRECMVGRTLFTPSYIDCYVWYHKKLIEKGLNGTWWDNCSINTIPVYDPETGKMDAVFNQLSRRELMKRLSTVAWEQMRRPSWLSNMHEDFSFTDGIWLVENEWYIMGVGRDMIEHMPLATFRAMACTKTMQLPAKPWIMYPTPAGHPDFDRVSRSVLGVLMAHDVQNNKIQEYLLGRYLNFYLDFDNGRECRFTGYWDVSPNTVSTGNPEVKASLYGNGKRKAALVWLLNADEADVTLDAMTFTSHLIGADIAKVLDAETGDPIAFELAEDKGNHKVYRLAPPLAIKRHEFRALLALAE
ncbi:MAG: DUF6067 family protein, partial [Kiritimatiellaeota bacterium]|nr:DUF6067 family protein [Kiritimatiellota bacterium]